MSWHDANHMLDTPECDATPDFELQPNGPIHVQNENEPDVMSLSVFIIPLTNRSVQRHRVRQMAPNLLSPFISQLETKQFSTIIDLKETIAFVFAGDLDAM
ncbi:hypothetical protein AAG906_028920 [Vitis piasezkii]